jgi:hypothetical protein
MMRYLVIAWWLSSSLHAVAEPTDSVAQKPLRYVFSVNSSMSFCSKCSQEGSLVAMPTSIHGIQVKRWRLGGGLGYTAFGQIRMMPYFGSATFNLFGKKAANGLFVQCDYGSAHAWLAPSLRENGYLKTVRGHDLFQISAGYAYHYHKLRLAAQLGFQSLKVTKVYEYGPISYLNSIDYIGYPASRTTEEYRIQRLYLSLSFGL